MTRDDLGVGGFYLRDWRSLEEARSAVKVPAACPVCKGVPCGTHIDVVFSAEQVGLSTQKAWILIRGQVKGESVRKNFFNNWAP